MLLLPSSIYTSSYDPVKYSSSILVKKQMNSSTVLVIDTIMILHVNIEEA